MSNYSPSSSDIDADIYNYFTTSSSPLSDDSSSVSEYTNTSPSLVLHNTAVEVVTEINVLLRKQCPRFFIKWEAANSSDLIYNLEIWNDSRQMAYITCDATFLEDKNELAIVIDSHTEIKYRKRNFNSLLRAIIVLIAYNTLLQLGDDTWRVVIQSQAMNPISFYTLVKSFNIQIEDVIVTGDWLGADFANRPMQAELEQLISQGPGDHITWSAVKQIYDRNTNNGRGSASVFLNVAITKANFSRADRLIYDIIRNMNCINGGNRTPKYFKNKLRRRRRRRLNSRRH